MTFTASMCSIGFQLTDKWKPDPVVEMATSDVINHVADAGFGAIEFWHGHVTGLDAHGLARTKAQLASRGLRVPMLSDYYNFTKSLQHAQDSLAKAHRNIELAKELGAANIRIFTGNHRSADASQEQWLRCRDCLQELADHAAQYDIGLAAETHDWNLMDTLPGCERLLEVVDRPNFGFIFQATTFSPSSYRWALKRLGPAVRHVHAPPKPTLQTGVFDYEAMLGHLKGLGISCCVSLEYMGPEPLAAARSDGAWLQGLCRKLS